MEEQFDELAERIKWRLRDAGRRLKAYFKRLLFPLYFFPIKLLTYSAYYLVKFLIKLILAFLGLIIETIIFPFRSLKNFLKSVFIGIILVYLGFSVFVIVDYIAREYGGFGAFWCGWGYSDKKLENLIVRVIGAYSEGSGFFIEEDKVLTNFHVIDGEPSPKIILPDGRIVTPIKITGHKDADLALLFTEEKFPQMVLPLPKENFGFFENEALLAAGYPLGTELKGKPTILRGRFIDFRKSRKDPITFIQTDINLVKGMSGGPLVDQCGIVRGVNAIGLGGLSLFIHAYDAQRLIPLFGEKDVEKIEVDPSKSPEEAVKAFYTYLKGRKMEEGFALLSREYLKKTHFEEWTSRFRDVLDVTVFKVERVEGSKDTVFVKFGTKSWIDEEVEYHYYEGTWQTIKEDGVYKMLKSKILEVENPTWAWFYE